MANPKTGLNLVPTHCIKEIPNTKSAFRMVSPDCGEKPGAKKVKVSCSKKATNGSSF
ncbi:MAG: hypothetical protein V4572_13130 [Bacteroidota bacterium]